MRLTILYVAFATILSGGVASTRAVAQSTKTNASTPLILEKNEGEQRTRRPRDLPMPSPSFTIKVDRKNGHSQKMWLATEDIPPGGLIARHKHLGQDEILLLQSGTAHASVGGQERDIHAGAIVFIPSGTWVSLKNIGTENISLAFVFSSPGFDVFDRCVSVSPRQPAAKLTAEEFKACEQEGRVTFADASPQTN